MSFPGELCSGSPRPLLFSQGRFIIRGAGWGGVRACVDTHLRKCRGHRAHSGQAGAVGQGCGSERGVPGLSLSPQHPSQQHLSSEVPQLKTGEASRCNGLGSPRHGPSSRCGSAGTQGDAGQAGSGSSGSWRESSGDPGAHSQCARHTLQGTARVQQRVREGQGGLRGQGSGRASEAGLRSCVQGPIVGPSGSWWDSWVQREQLG